MDEKTRKALQQTIITIATSAAAMVMGAILTYLTWKKGDFPVIGLIIIVSMGANIVPAVKRRRRIIDEINSKPTL